MAYKSRFKNKQKTGNKSPLFSPAKMVKNYQGEYMPKRGEVWLVFDLSNGHEGSRRYVWWFETKKEANNWIKFHLKSSPHAYDVSEPIMFMNEQRVIERIKQITSAIIDFETSIIKAGGKK